MKNKSWLRLLFLSALSFASVLCAVSGCENESYLDYEDMDEDDPLLQEQLSKVSLNGSTVVLSVDEGLTKTVSYSKDFGSGSNTFAATLIATATASARINAMLKVVPTYSGIRLNRISATLTGDWAIDGDVSASLKLTGNAAYEQNVVRQYATNGDLISESRLLKSFNIGSVKLPIGGVEAVAEFRLTCTGSAAAEFDAHISAGISGPIGYELVWDRNAPRGQVACSTAQGTRQLAHHWAFRDTTPTPTIRSPQFEIRKADGTLNMECSVDPVIRLDLSVGKKDVLEAALSANLTGGLVLGARANADANAGTWSAQARMGVRMNAYAGLTFDAIGCEEVKLGEVKFALIGTYADGYTIFDRTLMGTF